MKSDVGEVVATSDVVDLMARAARAAATGQASFEDVWEVNVRFTITDEGTNVHVSGLNKDSPTVEVMCVNGTEYDRDRNNDAFWNDRPAIQPWPTGDPLALILSLGEGEVRAVDRSGPLTTYRVPTSLAALARFCGEDHPDPEQDHPDDVEDRLWTIDDTGLLHQVNALENSPAVTRASIRFFGWGATPPVAAPLSRSPEVHSAPATAPWSERERDALTAFAEQVGLHLKRRSWWEDALFITGCVPKEGENGTQSVLSRLWLVGPDNTRAAARASRSKVLADRLWVDAPPWKLANSDRFIRVLGARPRPVNGRSQNLLIVHFARRDDGKLHGRFRWTHDPAMDTSGAERQLDDAAWLRPALQSAGIDIR
ncbi:hypothetical protein [Knoellia sp. Soil729]|uniref:hypothetical protein n=1 Tax=Knoellia sp. Soil729 TaxID=1736394 RepID=UPI0006FF6C1E|nr:hypothetical protein [Knoellia sp. Soil729]KRE42682.1 hypothetical protein ASG74_09900 [Knoellia sp. Soil729]